MNVRKYLNQSCIYTPPTGATDRKGNFTRAAPVTLKCRKTTKQKQVNHNSVRTYVDVSVYWTEEELEVGGLIDGEEIMSRRNIVDRKGNVKLWLSNPRPPLGFTP